MKVVGLLLAGGQSRRMGGGDKSLRMLGGISLLDRVIARLQPQVEAMVHQRQWRSGAICRFWSAGRGRQRSRFRRAAGRRAGRARLDSSQSAGLRVCRQCRNRRAIFAARPCGSAGCGAPKRQAPISPARLRVDARTRCSGFGRCGCARIYAMRWSPREYARSIRGLVDTNSRPSRFPIVR